MKRFLSRIIPALALCALASPALANPATLTINANVLRSCRVDNVAPSITLDYDVFTAGSETASTSLGVACTKDTTIQVSANGGLNAPAGGFNRSVSDGANALGYKLSLTAAGADLAVDTATNVAASQGKGVYVPVDFHVTLDTAVDPSAGAYSDTVVLTFTAL